jgi:hypothetical protein
MVFSWLYGLDTSVKHRKDGIEEKVFIEQWTGLCNLFLRRRIFFLFPNVLRELMEVAKVSGEVKRDMAGKGNRIQAYSTCTVLFGKKEMWKEKEGFRLDYAGMSQAKRNRNKF